jgi:hypothetical protein
MNKIINELFKNIADSSINPNITKMFRETVNESWETFKLFREIDSEYKEIMKQKNAKKNKDKIVFNDVKYKIKNGAAHVIGLTKDGGGLVRIPSSIPAENGDKYVVTGIKDYAFSDVSRLYGISIPGSVKRIKESTFDDCSNLERISLPDSIESIETEAFAWCKKLKPILIPESVKFISPDAFDYTDGTILWGSNGYLVNFANENHFCYERVCYEDTWLYIVKAGSL